MKFLGLVLLVIGSISCWPVEKKQGSAPSGFRQQPSSEHWYSGGVASSDQSGSPPLTAEYYQGPPAPQSPVAAEPDWAAGGPYEAPLPSEADSGAPAEVQAYLGGGHAPQDPFSGFERGQVDSEPVFSDVSALEPLFSFSSRSSYQRGKAVFAQTRYSPLEAVPPPPRRPVQRRPAQAPAKGDLW